MGPTDAKAQLVRRGLLYTTPRDSAHRSGKLAATLATPDASLFSLGTPFGVSHFSENPSTYKIVNNVVQFDDERGHWQPGAYVLPSINLVGTPGHSISAIVPANLNTSGQSSVGVGLTIGFNLNSKHTAGVGVAGAAIWSDITRLTGGARSPAESQSLDELTGENLKLDCKGRLVDHDFKWLYLLMNFAGTDSFSTWQEWLGGEEFPAPWVPCRHLKTQLAEKGGFNQTLLPVSTSFQTVVDV